MVITAFQPERSIDAVIEAFVHSRRRLQHLSTAEAVRAIRTLMPDLIVTDRELGDRVAKLAIQRGYTVFLDASVSK